MISCSRPPLRIRALLGLALAWSALIVSALIVSPLSAQPLGADTLARDLEQTIECRRLLVEDPVLGPLNLGVRVRNGVATLWGPVPSPLVSRRAEQCLRTLIELIEVRDQTHVDEDFDWSVPGDAAPVPLLLPEALPPMLPDPVRPPLVPRLMLFSPAEFALL